MGTPNFTKLACFAGLALCFTAAGVATATECTVGTSGSSLPGVFTVMQNGTISFVNGGQNDTCNAQIYGSTLIGVDSAHLVMAGNACQVTTAAKDASGNTSTDASGNIVTTTSRSLKADKATGTKRTLDKYVPSSASSSKWEDFSSISKLQGKNAQGKNVYTVAPGDYGIVSLPNDSMVIFTGAVKIRKLKFGACNSNASTTLGVTFADSSVNYIDEFEHQAACDIDVATGSGTAVLNILGASGDNWNSATSTLKANTSTSGFSLQSNSCLNMTPMGCLKMLGGDYSSWRSNRTSTPIANERYTLLNAQHPERLQINVYNGSFNTQGAYAMAAGVYVDNGDFHTDSGTPSTLVGEAVASNIYTQNNEQDFYFYKASMMEGNKTTVKAGYVYTPYSLAMTAITPVVHVQKCAKKESTYRYSKDLLEVVSDDGYAYVATQRDGTTASDGTQNLGISGDLVAYQLMSDGTYRLGDPAWQAATQLALMKSGTVTVNGESRGDAWRRAHMYTNDDQTSLTTVAKSSWAKNYVERILNPSKDELGSRASDSVFGRPWRTAPVIFGKSILFATEDGFLYSIDSKTGGFNWGWMPYEIGQKIQPIVATATDAAKKAAADALMTAHPWGQISTADIKGKSDVKYYVTGSALGGALHFSIQVNADGDQLVTDNGGIGFYDYRPGKNSPGGAYADIAAGVPTTGWPFGGAAPTAAVDQDYSGKVAYVVGHKLVVRNVDGSGDVSEHSLDTVLGTSDTESSNLIYWSDRSIMVGSTNRKLYEMSADGNKVNGVDEVDLHLPSGEPIFGLNGSFITKSGTADAKFVLAQTKSQVTVVRYDSLDGSPSWLYKWYTKTGGSNSSDPKVSAPPAMPTGASITALPAILPPTTAYGQSVLIPYTQEYVLNVACIADSDSKTTKAYSFGPLDMSSGGSLHAKNGLFTNADISLSDETGYGEATGIDVVQYVVDDCAGGSTTVIAGQAAASGTPKTFYDYGAKPPANGFVPQGKEAHGGISQSANIRVNWRELTNFF